MSQSPNPAIITARHYQAVCALALVTVFLLQMQQDINSLANGFMLFLGAVFILVPIRFSPLYVFLVLAVRQFDQQRSLGWLTSHAARPPELADLMLAMATLTYVGGQLRLNAIRSPEPQSTQRDQVVASTTRTDRAALPGELLWFLVSVPLCAAGAASCVILLPQHIEVADLSPGWLRFLALSWLLLTLMFVAGFCLRYWRSLQMDRATAQLLLQDVLWNETRGEQRRINRWIVWRKLKEHEEG
jgi:hypothetical protein